MTTGVQEAMACLERIAALRPRLCVDFPDHAKMQIAHELDCLRRVLDAWTRGDEPSVNDVSVSVLSGVATQVGVGFFAAFSPTRRGGIRGRSRSTWSWLLLT